MFYCCQIKTHLAEIQGVMYAHTKWLHGLKRDHVVTLNTSQNAGARRWLHIAPQSGEIKITLAPTFKHAMMESLKEPQTLWQRQLGEILMEASGRTNDTRDLLHGSTSQGPIIFLNDNAPRQSASSAGAGFLPCSTHQTSSWPWLSLSSPSSFDSS